MPYLDKIEEFLTEVMNLRGSSVTEDVMRRILRETIEKWEEFEYKDVTGE